jgi:hypothetical protein
MRTFVGLAMMGVLFLGCSDGGSAQDGGGDSGPKSEGGVLDSGSDGGTPTDGSAGDTGSGDAGSVPAGTIQGVVTKSAQLTFPGGDGKGTLWIDIGTSCPYQGNIQVTKTVTVPNADLTPANVMIPFTMTGVTPGTYFVWGWVDDNADGQPFPQGKDPGNYPTCPQVTLTANAGASVTLLFDGSNWN